MHKFSPQLKIIDGNPYIFLPMKILEGIFLTSNQSKGTIPVRGTVNGKAYQQTLLRYKGDWRLYINMKMLKNSPRRIGEIIHVAIEFDPSDRNIKAHPKFIKALKDAPDAKAIFDRLSPSRQKEINRYILNLKTEKSRDKNVARAINFLLGHESFVGRDHP